MFGSLLSQIRLSSVTFVLPNQGLKLSAIFFHHFVPQPSFDLRAKFYRDVPGNPSIWDVKRKRVSKNDVAFGYLIS